MSGRRISVRSLGYYMLKKLWLILLCMLALGFLLVGYKYLKDKKNQEDAENQEDTSVNLSATDLNDAKNAVIQYRYAKQMEKYLKESPLMKVDASKEKQTVVEYRIRLTGVDEVTSTGTLENSYLQLLRAYINDSVFVGDLQALNAEYSEHAYIKELVWCNNTNGGEYTVGVIETDAFPTLAKDLRTVVEAYMDQLMKEDVRLKITPVKENTVVVYDSSTDTNQKAAYSSLISFRKNYSTAYTNFSAAQQTYFRDKTDFMADEKEKIQKPGFSKRYFVIGLAGGGILGICLCFIFLYLSLKHASPADYSDNLGLRNLGIVFVDGKKHPYRDMLVKKELKSSLFENGEESAAYAGVRLGAYCKKHDIRELAVLCSVNKDCVSKAVEELKKELKKSDVELLLTEKVGTDSEALKKLVEAQYCILVEQLYGGNRQKASELLQFCRENEVEVIGALGVAQLTL